MGEWGRVGRMEGGKKEHGEVVEGGQQTERSKTNIQTWHLKVTYISNEGGVGVCQ